MKARKILADLCVVKRGTDCMHCSSREERWGVEIVDNFGGGGFNFFICEECLHRLIYSIEERKNSG